MGAIIGLAVFLIIYGYEVIIPTNTGWLMHSKDLENLDDLTQHYLGWLYYRKSVWHFPIGLIDGLTAEPISVAYTDAIPLFAIFFKLLSPLLPENFQYFGMFGVMTYMLMGGLGALITRRYTDNVCINCASAVFFALSPILLKRMFYHTALSGHFVILAAICLWIYKKDIIPRQLTAWWTFLSVIATLINPYYTPMIIGILCGSVLQDMIEGGSFRKALKKMSSIAISLAAALGVGYVEGLFYGHVSPSGDSITQLSFNLIQLFNPIDYIFDIQNYQYNATAVNDSLILNELGVTDKFQYEGFSYLGLGIMILLVPAVVALVRKLVDREYSHRKKTALIIPLSIELVAFVFLALSPTATCSDHIIYAIHYPELIYKGLSIFRSTGRFIWPIHFGIMAGALILLAMEYEKNERNHGKRVSYVIVLAVIGCLLVQVIDLSPAIRRKHVAYALVSMEDTSSYLDELRSDAWQILAENGKELMFYEQASIGVYCNPHQSLTLEEYAYANDMIMNAAYCSRNNSIYVDALTAEHFAERRVGLRDDSIIYIFYPYSELPADVGLNYYRIDGYTIGTERNLDGIEGVEKI